MRRMILGVLKCKSTASTFKTCLASQQITILKTSPNLKGIHNGRSKQHDCHTLDDATRCSLVAMGRGGGLHVCCSLQGKVR